MGIITYGALVDLVRRDAPPIPIADDSVGISYPRAASDTFIEPSLEYDSVPGAQVLLIDAPAAVGKSTLAKHLASSAGTVRWDLATTQVGANGFTGGLTKAMGPESVATVLRDLSTGRRTVLVDALDEAHLRSGYQNLEAFIRDIAGSVAGSPAITVVLLARVETAVVVRLMLEAAGATVSTARLDYFDEESANRFLDRRLTVHWANQGRPAVHHRNPAVYRSAVDGVFGFVFACLGVGREDAWRAEAVRSFLGYAPVLEAIADYLAVDNIQALVQEIESASTEIRGRDSGPWRFLMRVIDSIVARETDKVIPVMRTSLADVAATADFDDWGILYLHDEQVDRVLRRTFRIERFSDHTPTVPQRFRDEYERVLDPVADQHPFLADARRFANLVFQEYAFAWALVRGAGSVSRTVTSTIRAASYLPSPLLGRFLIALSPRSGEGSPTIAPEFVGLLFDSLSASAVRSGDVLFWLLNTSANETRGQIVTQEGGIDEVQFIVDQNRSDPVRFWRSLSNADVTVSGGVLLGIPGQTLTLGPFVSLQTDLLDVQAAEIVVVGDSDSYVELFADQQLNTDPNTRLKVYTEGEFGVSWEPLVHPWFQYAVERPDTESQSAAQAVFPDLVRILRQFRKHRRGQFARKRELIDNVIVGRDHSDRSIERANLVAFLLDRGVLGVSGGFYVLDLDPLGMTWEDVKRQQITEAAADLLAEFVAAQAPL